MGEVDYSDFHPNVGRRLRELKAEQSWIDERYPKPTLYHASGTLRVELTRLAWLVIEVARIPYLLDWIVGTAPGSED